MARRTLLVLLSLLALFLLGALAVLSTVSWYLAINPAAYLTEPEVFAAIQLKTNHTAPLPLPLPPNENENEKIPRILHQTWRSDVLPDRWRVVSQGCKDLMPDYHYILWTDESSRAFIEEHYPWFLNTFDGYKWPIQRADAIRYFVLHHYGGVYLDLDVGCLRRLDPLLHYQVVLPKTIPVGVSNDLMFSAKGHPFMEQTIRHLITFDHSYVLNYPTVMFTTGPMFLSAQYGLYTASHPLTPDNPGGDVRILPKSLYGKNAKVEEAPNAFFSHHYGSSWHADDAAFITFLGRSGMRLMWVGFLVLVLGVIRLFLQSNRKGHGRSLRRRLALARYDLLLPRSRNGSYHLDIVTTEGSASTTTNTSPLCSPTSTSPPSPTSSRIPLVPFSVEMGPLSASSSVNDLSSLRDTAADAFKRAGAWARAYVPGESSPPPPSTTGPSSRTTISRGWRAASAYNRLSGSASGIMLLLPAIFAPSSRSNTGSFPNAVQSLEISDRDEAPRLRTPEPGRGRADSKERMERKLTKDLEAGGVNPPPPYGFSGASRRQQLRESNIDTDVTSTPWNADDGWAWPVTPETS